MEQNRQQQQENQEEESASMDTTPTAELNFGDIVRHTNIFAKIAIKVFNGFFII
jgi:hypothetical protein